jgi:hypothetical protein
MTNKLNPRYLNRQWQNRLMRKPDGSRGLERPSQVIDLDSTDTSLDGQTGRDTKSKPEDVLSSKDVPEIKEIVEVDDPEKASISNYMPPRGLKAWLLRKRRGFLNFYHFLRPPLTEDEIQEKKDKRIIAQIRQDGSVFARRLSNYWGTLRLEHIEQDEGKKIHHKVPFGVMLYDWDQDQHKGGNIIKLYFSLGSARWPYGILPGELISQEVLNASLPALHHHVSGFSDRAGAGVIIQRAGFQGLPELTKIGDMWNIMGENRPPLTWCFGPTLNGQVVWRNLVDMPHLLIAGTTDSGKSTAINGNICTMLRNNPTPETLQLALFDMKEGVEFSYFEGIPHLYPGIGIVDDPDMVMEKAMPLLITEMKSRLRMIKAHYKNVKEYNLHHYKDNRFPMLVVVFDEISLLVDLFGNSFIKPLSLLARSGRAAGIHVVISTQYPKAEVIPTLITLNFPARLVFHMTQGGSMSVMEDPRATELVGKGRAILFDHNEYTTVQIPYISDAEIRAVVEEIKTGKHVKAEAYDIEEILQYALTNYSGNLPQDALYQVFKKKGITFSKMRSILNGAADSGHVYDLSGTPYKVIRGTGGQNPRRMVRLDTIPTITPTS